jgi:hypothetical protein
MEGIMKDKILEKDEKVIYECRPNIKEASVPERGNLIMAIVLFIMFILSVIFLIVPGMILLGLMTGAIFYVVIHDSLKNKEIALNEEYIITDKRIIIYNKKEYHDIYVKCMAKLRAVTRITGALDWCQGDTKGIGIFAKKFGVMPFAQGFLIRSFERKK